MEDLRASRLEWDIGIVLRGLTGHSSRRTNGMDETRASIVAGEIVEKLLRSSWTMGRREAGFARWLDQGRELHAARSIEHLYKLQLEAGLPRDLETKIVDVGIEEDIRRNELRWIGLELGMREDEIRALLTMGLAVAERHIEALRVDP